MIIKQYPLTLTLNYPLHEVSDLTRVAYFDIETTGFSAETTYLYLIGCIYYENSSFYIIQWFSEEIKEESLLLTSFFQFLSQYDVLIHYNGTGFDIPYITKKCRQLNLPYSFDNLESLDIYKKIIPYKNLLQLKSYKQKAIEEFLEINRKDTLNGEQLIELYANYVGRIRYEKLRRQSYETTMISSDNSASASPSADDLLRLLLLHNEDDLKGLVQISPMLSYSDLFEKPFPSLRTDLTKDTLLIQIELATKLPKVLKHSKEFITLSVKDNKAVLSLPIFQGELKHFYENYKDYFYLPQEDTVLHKSLASFVDKEFRMKAKAVNCYTKKEGSFAPQFEVILQPTFKQQYQDKLTFFELNPVTLANTEWLEPYTKHLLHYLSK